MCWAVDNGRRAAGDGMSLRGVYSRDGHARRRCDARVRYHTSVVMVELMIAGLRGDSQGRHEGDRQTRDHMHCEGGGLGFNAVDSVVSEVFRI